MLVGARMREVPPIPLHDAPGCARNLAKMDSTSIMLASIGCAAGLAFAAIITLVVVVKRRRRNLHSITVESTGVLQPSPPLPSTRARSATSALPQPVSLHVVEQSFQAAWLSEHNSPP